MAYLAVRGDVGKCESSTVSGCLASPEIARANAPGTAGREATHGRFISDVQLERMSFGPTALLLPLGCS